MTARLYLAPDGYGDMTIWRETGDDRDEAVLTRTGGNAAGFDALAGLVAAADRAALAKAWSEGMRTGSSRAMRHMSDEPGLALASEADNPYRAALTGGATR